MTLIYKDSIHLPETDASFFMAIITISGNSYDLLMVRVIELNIYLFNPEMAIPCFSFGSLISVFYCEQLLLH